MTRRKKSRTKAQSAPSGQVDIRQARTQPSRLIERATDGEEIIITKSGKPVARLVPYTPKGAVRPAEHHVWQDSNQEKLRRASSERAAGFVRRVIGTNHSLSATESPESSRKRSVQKRPDLLRDRAFDRNHDDSSPDSSVRFLSFKRQIVIVVRLGHRPNAFNDGLPMLSFIITIENIAVGGTGEERTAAVPNVHRHAFDVATDMIRQSAA